MAKEHILDLITAIDIIEAVEKSPYYGDWNFLEMALGAATAKHYHQLGYIFSGNYLCTKTNKNVRTYGVNQRYIYTRDAIARERRCNCWRDYVPFQKCLAR